MSLPLSSSASPTSFVSREVINMQSKNTQDLYTRWLNELLVMRLNYQNTTKSYLAYQQCREQITTKASSGKLEEYKSQIWQIKSSKCQAVYEKIVSQKNGPYALSATQEKEEFDFLEAFRDLASKYQKFESERKANRYYTIYKKRKEFIQDQLGFVEKEDFPILLNHPELKQGARPLLEKMIKKQQSTPISAVD